MKDRWSRKTSAALALLMLVPAPSIGVLVALLGARDETGKATLLAQGVWALSKVWILLLPVLWHRFVDGLRPGIPRPHARGMPVAVTTGVLISVVVTASYLTVGRQWIDTATVGPRIAASGLDRFSLYLLMAFYWCTINALLEEYVWRWFVFTRCEALLPRRFAVVFAGLLFTIHHAIAMGLQFSDPRVVTLATLGVWIGGASWSWIYLRWRNVYAAWASHAIVDVTIFWIGYRLIFLSG